MFIFKNFEIFFIILLFHSISVSVPAGRNITVPFVLSTANSPQNAIGKKEAATARTTAGSRFATRIFFPHIRFTPTQKIHTLPTSDR